MLGAYICTPGLDDHLLHPDGDARSQAKAALETELLPGERLATLSNFYSHFRPYRRQAERKVQWKHPAGDVPGSRTYGGGQYYGNNSTVRTFSPAMAYAATPASTAGIGAGLRQWGTLDDAAGVAQSPAQSTATTQAASREQTVAARAVGQSQNTHANPSDTSPNTTDADRNPSLTPSTYDPTISSTDLPASDAQGITSAQLSHPTDIPPPEKVKVHVNLDESDNLHQLCANVSIFIPGPRPGIFRGFQDVLKDGVLRVWRGWLGERVLQRDGDGDGGVGREGVEGVVVDGKGKGKGKVRADSLADGKNPRHDPSILWVGHGSSVGVRFGVQQKKWNRPGPVLRAADEEGPVSYELVYEGMFFHSNALAFQSCDWGATREGVSVRAAELC